MMTMMIMIMITMTMAAAVAMTAAAAHYLRHCARFLLTGLNIQTSLVILFIYLKISPNAYIYSIILR